MNLRKKLIRLAYKEPETRPYILPLLVESDRTAKDKYPWDQCVKDQMKQYGDKETAEKVCGKIKAESQGLGKSKKD